ncbi:MAG TPA: PilZ domain-containing protein [Pyrinomonadaceae bacterium]|nr:PilZ domain-containing protein [Pyrinomonadaceae bacterium]
MLNERRRAERYQVNLAVQWESASAQRQGTISDISTSGCFILTTPEIVATEPVWVGIQLPKGKSVTLPGQAVYLTEEIGFAMRFIDLGLTEQRFLQRLVETARKKSAGQGAS